MVRFAVIFCVLLALCYEMTLRLAVMQWPTTDWFLVVPAAGVPLPIPDAPKVPTWENHCDGYVGARLNDPVCRNRAI